MFVQYVRGKNVNLRAPYNIILFHAYAVKSVQNGTVNRPGQLSADFRLIQKIHIDNIKIYNIFLPVKTFRTKQISVSSKVQPRTISSWILYYTIYMFLFSENELMFLGKVKSYSIFSNSIIYEL